MHPRLDEIDRRIADWMERWGHMLHRWSLAIIFLWFGLLKVFGYESGTSIIAKAVYFGRPEVTVPILGAWEAVIGVCLAFPFLLRIALPLLALRLIGTLAAFVLKPDVCFGESILVPTIQGQYLVKDFLLFSAAMVIGATVREERPHPRRRGSRDAST
ncbi:MAG: hypothetical protein VYC34_03325 [Planctomycetota bacterium]|nr:hypothetical protein [Planctomycetota bacterium]